MEARWYVNKIKATTWKEKTGAPLLNFDNEYYFDENSARHAVQNIIAKICSEKNVENIYWTAKHVEISYNYGDDVNKLTEEILSLDILRVDDRGVTFITIGSRPDEE